MFIGFVALFLWDGGAPEIKIVLALILVRVCFSWGEVAVLEKHLFEMNLEAQKQGALLQMLMFELDQKITKAHGDEEHRGNPLGAVDAYMEKMKKFDGAAKQAYEDAFATQRISSLSKSAKIWVSIGGSVGQIAVIALVAWGITKLINAI